MKLKRELGLLDVFCIASGAMISSGLFVLPGLAHAKAGPAVIASYVIAGLLAMTGMLSQAELVSAMPRAGGTYFYVARSMGPAVATVDGLLTWFSISLKSSFALVGMAAFTHLILGMDPRLIAAAFCALFIILNYIGVKVAGKAQVGIVLILIVLLVFYVFRGWPSVDYSNLRPLAPHGFAGVFSAAGFVFISYGGLLKVASVAEEVKDPAKTVPLGMITSLVFVGALYALVVFITTGVLPGTQLDHSLTPVSDGANVFLGRWGVLAMAFAAMLAFISTANAGIMSASRYPLALSRDRLLPDFFASVHSRFKTPHVSIIFTGILMIIAVFLKLDVLVKVASTMLIFTFIFSGLCVIIMRESRVQNYQPRFRSPFYPWTQIIGIFGCWQLVVGMGKIALYLGSTLFACGMLVYWFYGRERAKKDFALLHLVERLTARELVDVTLEEELKEIIRERDEIVKDRFDRAVEEAIVLDIKGPMSAEDFFRLASDKLSERFGMDAEEIHGKFIEREKESSTVLATGLAIPHIIVEGEKKFVMLLARCKEGIEFPETENKVKTVFVIAGTRDERNFHLRALSAIAQIVQDAHFEKRWMRAKDEKGLRDIILLGKRRRH
ncbi:MAG: amino acid permease [Candidatus Omnitrophota bacterium]|jgi:amino acid transporter/mannitol/fructose-specific phosphotransferase system IIA component (Ntr-type)